LFGFSETSYDEARRWLQLIPGKSSESPCTIKSRANGKSFSAGTFSTPMLADLRAKGRQILKEMRPGSLKVSNELGDVAKKHTEAENRYATFQVASQFNCLEFVRPQVVPEEGVTKYVCDRTQGPACSIACGPATVFRNYFAQVRSGDVEGQTRYRQIDNLADVSRVLGNDSKGKLFEIKGGYTLSDGARLRKLDEVLMQLTEQGKLDDVRAALRIGVHKDVQVTSCSWGEQRVEDSKQAVTQVFGSACAVAYNHNTDNRSWRNFASIVLEASYEATLWAALLNAHDHGGRHGSRRVFLTCLGGGVFGNSMSWIMQAMHRAFEQFKDCDLDVRIVTYAGQIDPQLLAIEQEYRGLAADKKIDKKRARVEDVNEDVVKKARSSSSVGAETPSGKNKEADSFPNSPLKAVSHPAPKRSTARSIKTDQQGKETPQPTLDATVLREAERLGYEGLLRNLASRPEVAACRVTARVMLEALKSTGGLVNPAKHAIVGK
jgi:hypothetical protein